MKRYHNFLTFALMAMLCMLPLASCDSSKEDVNVDQPVTETFDVRLVLPSKIHVVVGESFKFSVEEGYAPVKGDVLFFEGSDGFSHSAEITEIGKDYFYAIFSKTITDGTYRIFIRRGDRRKQLGTVEIAVVTNALQPTGDANLYGRVVDGDKPVEGVVISDGVEVVITDADGVYNITSAKKYGYVFMSIPEGYEVKTNGVLPRMYTRISDDPKTIDRADFELHKVNDPDNYKVLFFGDMHLANRTNDVNQFHEFTDDVNDYLKAHANEKIYAITLGDMTWDLYWYDNKFQFTEYLNLVNAQLGNLTIFHTMGNHDNDMLTVSDFAAEVPYRRSIAPNFYSFNIGKIHYVVLDDIDCSAYDGTKSRNYAKNVSQDQLTWLVKDLKYVDKSCKVVVTAHAPFFRPVTDKSYFKYDHDEGNTNNLLSILDGYDVHFVTGHTHQNFSVAEGTAILGGRKVNEHNVAAVCADWWWSVKMTPGLHLSTDGSPAGYSIWDVKGNDFTNVYKGTGLDASVQFHSYDLNNVSVSLSDVPLMPTNQAAVKTAFDKYAAAYPASSKNEVLLNVWNYNPAWEITVTTENGQTLTPTQTWAYDPLHIIGMSLKRLNNASLTSAPSFMTEKAWHFFKVTAPDADTDLTITVKDEYGNVWAEKMERPKPFSTGAYINK